MRLPACLFALALLVPGAAHADPLLDRLIAELARAPVVGFERTIEAKGGSEKGKLASVVVDRFTPTSATGGRWTLVSVDGRTPTKKEAEALAKRQDAPPGFHKLGQILRLPLAARSDQGGRTLFRWNGLPQGTIITPGGDISASLSAEATVEEAAGKPLLTRFRIFAAQPIRVKVVATIHNFDLVSQYRPGANGVPFLTSQALDTNVSAPMGFGGRRQQAISYRPM